MSGSRTLSLAVSMPEQEIGNDYWLVNYPDVVTHAESKNWMWPSDHSSAKPVSLFKQAMMPYIDDPFRGARFRRFLPFEERLIVLENKAASEAMALADVRPDDLDLILCATFPPDEVVIGNASILAAELGCRGDAWNIESACSGYATAVMTAHRLIQAGQYHCILVVTSCGYSKTVDFTSPVSWGVGDGAVATVIAADNRFSELLGCQGVHTGESFGAVSFDLEMVDGAIQRRLRIGKNARDHLGERLGSVLRTCTEGALKKSGRNLQDIDFFVFNNPLAWYPDFCCRLLGILPEKALCTYPLYANVGPAMTGINLFHAAWENRIGEGDLVLVYSVGSVSSCRAIVLQWGDVKLGLPPSPTRTSQNIDGQVTNQSVAEHENLVLSNWDKYDEKKATVRV